MYLIPQEYKCIKCGYIASYSPHDSWPAPVLPISENPVCPQCWEVFLCNEVGGIMTLVRPIKEDNKIT